MQDFETIYGEALLRQGSQQALKSRLPVPKTPDDIRQQTAEYYLSLILFYCQYITFQIIN